MKKPALVLTVSLTALLGLVFAGSAQANFHLMQIREVYPGSAADPAADYVELQMFSGGQNFVSGHSVSVYTAEGKKATATFGASVANGANQSTILIASPKAATHFGVVPDLALPDADTVNPGGGLVCFDDLDCVAWGTMSTIIAAPSPVGTAAAAIPEGSALQRSIARGCATFLDPADDSNNSAADFAPAVPAPRPNSVAPSERTCTGTGNPGGGGSKSGHNPQTILRGKPARRSADRTPTFRFTSNHPAARFECKLDRRRFKRCRSPFTAKPLSPGAHVFRVRAVEDDHTDPTPAVYRFRVLSGR